MDGLFDINGNKTEGKIEYNKVIIFQGKFWLNGHYMSGKY